MGASGTKMAPFELTPAELTLLALSNGDCGSHDSGSDTKHPVITTKKSYIWGSFIALVINERIKQGKTPDAAQFYDSLQASMSEVRPESLPPVHKSGDPGRSVFQRVARRLLFIADREYDTWFEGLTKTTNEAYDTLLKRGLIADPFHIPLDSLTLTAIGLIPLSFSRQTAAGKQHILRIRTMFLDYEQSFEDGKKIIDVRFNLFRFLHVLFTGAIDGYKQDWKKVEKTFPAELSLQPAKARGKASSKGRKASRKA